VQLLVNQANIKTKETISGIGSLNAENAFVNLNK
jgi:hypothetical protein